MIVTKEALTFPFTSDLEPFRRVLFNAGTKTLAYAAAANRSDGTLVEPAIAANSSVVGVVPWHCSGTRKMVASGAIAAYGYYSNDADGKIKAEATLANAKGRLQGRAATADGDIIEVSPFSNAD